MNTITTPTEVRARGRRLGKIEDTKIQQFIDEVEMTVIRPQIGDTLYLLLTSGETLEEPYATLVNGGTYTYNDDTSILVGMKTAIAYYVYAQNVLAGDFESTRYGMRLKEDDNSQILTQKERADIAGGATNIADAYMAECLEYCTKMSIAVGNRSGLNLTAGCIIRKISVQ